MEDFGVTKDGDQYVRFKSIPENFDKEADGRKPNTLRKWDGDDMRFCLLDPTGDPEMGDPVTHIVIECTEGHKGFIREITDVTFWQGWLVISWKHPVKSME